MSALLETAEVRDFRAACTRHRDASARYASAAADVSAQLRAAAARHALSRSILVVEDCHSSALVLVHCLIDLAPVHVVTSDVTASALAALTDGGALVHVSDCCASAPAVWREERSAVVVVDASLGGGTCGATVIAALPRGPSVVLISSIADGGALADAAHSVDAVPIARAVDGWEARLRAVVSEALTREFGSE